MKHNNHQILHIVFTIIIVKDKDGKERQLHVQQSIDVTTVPSNNDSNKLFTNTHLDHGSKTCYVESEFFTVDCYRMEGENIVVNDKPFQMVSILEGEGTLDGQAVKKG